MTLHEDHFLVRFLDRSSVGGHARLDVIDFLAAVGTDGNVEHFVGHLVESVRVVQFVNWLLLMIRCRVAFVEAALLFNDEVVVAIRHNS